MEFSFGPEQWLSAANALVGAGGLGVFVLTGKGRLGPLLPGHKVLILRKLFAPSGIVLLQFIGHVYSRLSARLWLPFVEYETQPAQSRLHFSDELG